MRSWCIPKLSSSIIHLHSPQRCQHVMAFSNEFQIRSTIFPHIQTQKGHDTHTHAYLSFAWNILLTLYTLPLCDWNRQHFTNSRIYKHTQHSSWTDTLFWSSPVFSRADTALQDWSIFSIFVPGSKYHPHPEESCLAVASADTAVR